MNTTCPQHVWNHDHGCLCTPAFRAVDAPAGSSPFGTYADSSQESTATRTAMTRPGTAVQTADGLPAAAGYQPLYDSVDALPLHVQDQVLTAAMRGIAEERYGRLTLTSHEYGDLYDEVAERAERHLFEDYDEIMAEHGLDGHPRPIGLDEIGYVRRDDIHFDDAAVVARFAQGDTNTCNIHHFAAGSILATEDGKDLACFSDAWLVTDATGGKHVAASQSEALRVYADFITRGEITTECAAEAGRALSEADRLERRGL